MEFDTVDVIFPKGLPAYLKGKTLTLKYSDPEPGPDTARNPDGRNTADAPGQPSPLGPCLDEHSDERNRGGHGAAAGDPAAPATPCENEPNEPVASGTTSHQPQAASGREAPRKSRAEASRQNGRKSRGPKTPEGKARSSRNALKHGLTARFVTINSEENDEWESFLAGCREELQPVGVLELSYADEFASSRWRLRRCLGIETVIFDDEFAHQEAEIQKYKLIDDVGRTGLAFKKAKEDLNALGRYETRIRRAGERALANLLKLQSLRPNEPEDSEGDPPQAGGDTLWVSPPAHEPPDPEGATLRVSPPAQESRQNEPTAHAAGEPPRGCEDREGDTLRVSPPVQESRQNEPTAHAAGEPPRGCEDREGDTLWVSPPAQQPRQNEPSQASTDASRPSACLPDSAKSDTFTLERPYANGHPDPFRRPRGGANE